METIKLSLNFPTEEYVNQYLQEKKYAGVPKTKVLHFEYTSEQNNYEVINSLHKTLKNCEQGDNILLIGYSLLSQLNVGLLNLLARFFVSLIFQSDIKVGYVIILNYYISDSEMQNYEKILQVAETANSKDMIVLTVFSMLDLCGKGYSEIRKSNVKNNFQY